MSFPGQDRNRGGTAFEGHHRGKPSKHGRLTVRFLSWIKAARAGSAYRRAQIQAKVSAVSYYFSRTINASQSEAIERVTAALAHQGFGILTQIDVAETMKARLGVEFRPYVILGACNPHFAWRALQQEDKVGTMLPCNVIVTEIRPGTVEIAAVDPVSSMAAIPNVKLGEIAATVGSALHEAVAAA